jgi:hypothetical protein
MESFGRISLFPGLPLASSKFFGFLDLNLFFRFRMEVCSVFTDARTVVLQVLDSIRFFRIWIPGFSDVQDFGSTVSRMFGFFGFF